MPIADPSRPILGAILSCLLAACSLAPTPGVVQRSPTPRSTPSAPIATASPTEPTTPTPVPNPSSVPSPVPLPSATLQPGAVLPGFSPLSTTWVSLSMGWVLGHAQCPSGDCLALLRSVDAGRSWSAVTGPPALPSLALAPGGVHNIRFADQSNGWAFDPELWATHDGGSTWRRQDLALPGAFRVDALEASAGSVHATVTRFDSFRTTVYQSLIATDAWRPTSVSMSAGAGPVPRAQIVASQGAAWVVQVNRTVTGGARFSNGEWQDWRPPCADSGGSAYLAAASATYLAARCNEGVWSNGPPRTLLYISTDAGSTFRPSGVALPASAGGGFDSPRPGMVVSGAYGADGHATLLQTLDGGANWSTVYGSADRTAVLYVGFTSADQGVAILTGESGSTLLMTFDGGRHWSPVSFASAP